jgi:hypothetical protein
MEVFVMPLAKNRGFALLFESKAAGELVNSLVIGSIS